MVKIYDIQDYRDDTQIELAITTSSANDAEILLFTGVRYERLCDKSKSLEDQPRRFQEPLRADIFRTGLRPTLKTI